MKTSEYKKIFEKYGYKISDNKKSKKNELPALPEHKWNKMYNLAKIYYEHHGNLNINRYFKTKNGYEYDPYGVNLGAWISTQAIAFKGQRVITEERIRLLNNIGMLWLTNKVNKKLIEEEIIADNNEKKKKELLNRVRLFLIKREQRNNCFKSKRDIERLNNEFLKFIDSIGITKKTNEFDNKNLKLLEESRADKNELRWYKIMNLQKNTTIIMEIYLFLIILKPRMVMNEMKKELIWIIGLIIKKKLLEGKLVTN